MHDSERLPPQAMALLVHSFTPSTVISVAPLCLNSDFFKGGQGNISEVYYDTDISGYLAFDWAHNGLEATARTEIEEGIVLWSRYKMRAMDRWTQTANLVFKPTSTVALAGLATENRELIEW